MTLQELEAVATSVPLLEARIEQLEVKLAKLNEAPPDGLPEWVSLKQAAAYAGISYASLRRGENKAMRPGRGQSDGDINGVAKWRRKTVIQWADELGLVQGTNGDSLG